MNANCYFETYRDEAERAVAHSSYEYTDAAFEKLFLNAYFKVRDTELFDVEEGSDEEYDIILDAYLEEIRSFESTLGLVHLKD